MDGITGQLHPGSPQAKTEKEEDAKIFHQLEPDSGFGWTVALSVWVIAFMVLVLFELWNFFFPLIRSLFS